MTRALLEYLADIKVTMFFAHNASLFDSILLLRLISSLRLAQPDLRLTATARNVGGQIRGLDISYSDNVFHIKDSYLILKSSLRDLCVAYGVEEKGVFPHRYMSEETLGHKGAKPDIKFYNDLTVEAYEKVDKIVDMKELVTKYLSTDCVSLYHVISKFRSSVLEKFKVDCINRESAAGLAYVV